MILKHIAGSTFGLILIADECPIADPDGEAIDTTEWGVSLRLVGDALNPEITGQWLETTGPWSMSFEARDTIAWPTGPYAVRLVYTEPGDGGRRFEIETDMNIEVCR